MDDFVFRTQYGDKLDRVARYSYLFRDPDSVTGSPVRDIYEGRYDDDGRIVLDLIGREDLYGYIQSHRDSVDINVLLNRYRNGDVDALNRINGIYGDFTSAPASYAEMLNTVIRGEHEFYKLPLEVRERFNNSFGEFVASMGKPDFFERAGYGAQSKVADLSDQVVNVADDSNGGVVSES